MMTNEWREFAACRGADPELFYPIGEDWSGPGNQARAQLALAVCASCPVQLECLIEAHERGDAYAVLGGTLPDQRRDLARIA